MLWVLIRSTSGKHFQWVPTTCFYGELEKIFSEITKYFSLTSPLFTFVWLFVSHVSQATGFDVGLTEDVVNVELEFYGPVNTVKVMSSQSVTYTFSGQT